MVIPRGVRLSIHYKKKEAQKSGLGYSLNVVAVLWSYVDFEKDGSVRCLPLYCSELEFLCEFPSLSTSGRKAGGGGGDG